MLARSGEGEAATTLCKALLDECKDNIWRGQILTILARAKLKMGQKEEARQHLDQALELLTRHNPNEPAWLTRQKAESHRVAAEALRLECT
jgi:tetratricopeptide (TPR) repeat protein